MSIAALKKNWIPACAGMTLMVLGTSACAPRDTLLPAVFITPPSLHDFPADFQPPRSAETDRPMSGFGGGGSEGLRRTPVIFIHGNTVSARFWLPARGWFREAGGYSGDELWALGYGWDSVRYFDSNDLSVPSVDRIVNSVTKYLERKTGKPVPQVDIIGHSLGVTLVRQWMKQTNSWHRVRSFIGACGANQGVWTAWPDSRGQNRNVSWELAPGSPWLTQLNRGGETPGATRYMTLYDGNGWSDVLFPEPYQHSSALKGAYNLPFNVEYGTYFDHLALPREPETMEAMINFLRQTPDPVRTAPPQILREGDVLRSGNPDQSLRCTIGELYPNQSMAGVNEFTLAPGALYTCYAYDSRSRLSSPMARYQTAAPLRSEPLTLRATPDAGNFEEPQRVTLSASDPQAYITYTTSGTTPNSGSPLYTGPIYVSAPLSLRAVAFTADGRQSQEFRADYDISLELVEARHTLQRQFDPSAPVHYHGERKKGK